MLELALMMSGVIIFGPMEENTAIFGAGLVFKTANVCEILATGYLKQKYSQICNQFDLRNAKIVKFLDMCNFQFTFVYYFSLLPLQILSKQSLENSLCCRHVRLKLCRCFLTN